MGFIGSQELCHLLVSQHAHREVPVWSWLAELLCVLDLQLLVFVLAFLFLLSFSIRSWKLSLRSLVLAAVCISVAVVWGVYRNEDRYVWTEHH